MPLSERKVVGIHPLDHYKKAMANPGSRPLAIRGYCHSCSGGQPDRQTMQEVSDCTVGSCALWRVRPVKAAQETADEPEDRQD